MLTTSSAVSSPQPTGEKRVVFHDLNWQAYQQILQALGERHSARLTYAYYIQNQALVAGRKVDLQQDPPPDLVVEVDITHTDIDKLRLYASLGVPEFWRYNGQTWRIYQLQTGEYQEQETSPTFAFVPKQKLYEFLAQALQDEVAAEQTLRSWIRQQRQP